MQRTGAEVINYSINEKRSDNMKYVTISSHKPLAFPKEILLLFITAAFAVLYFCFVALPVISIFRISGISNISAIIQNQEVETAIKLSLMTSGITLVLTFLLGTPVAFFVSAKKGMLAKAGEIIVHLPTILPPAVAGIGLLLAFGRNGIIGHLFSVKKIDIVFTPLAVILAQLFVSSAFYIQILKNGIDSVEKEIYEASFVFGAGKMETFFRIILPMMKKNIIAGLIVSWTRAMGEFGATIMFAGNIVGKTRTMPLQIYTLMQMDIGLAASVSVILFLISFCMLFIVKAWLGK